MNRLRPFFSFYGSKYRLAPRYSVPLYDAIVESFAGSAAYACLHYQRKVTLYEKNEHVAAIWQFLITARPAEILAIPLLGNGDTIEDLGDVCQEAKYLVGFWLNKGTAHLHYRPGAWMRTGLYPDQFWGDKIRSRIASQVDLIKHWKFGGYDYRDADVAQSATWFIDPPYEGPKGRLYYGRCLNYADLGRWCRSLRGQVIACEGFGAKWLPFQPFAVTRGTAANNSRELLFEANNP